MLFIKAACESHSDNFHKRFSLKPPAGLEPKSTQKHHRTQRNSRWSRVNHFLLKFVRIFELFTANGLPIQTLYVLILLQHKVRIACPLCTQLGLPVVLCTHLSVQISQLPELHAGQQQGSFVGPENTSTGTHECKLDKDWNMFFFSETTSNFSVAIVCKKWIRFSILTTASRMEVGCRLARAINPWLAIPINQPWDPTHWESRHPSHWMTVENGQMPVKKKSNKQTSQHIHSSDWGSSHLRVPWG